MVLKKLTLDQLIVCPTFLVFFLSSNELLQGSLQTLLNSSSEFSRSELVKKMLTDGESRICNV